MIDERSGAEDVGGQARLSVLPPRRDRIAGSINLREVRTNNAGTELEHYYSWIFSEPIS